MGTPRVVQAKVLCNTYAIACHSRTPTFVVLVTEGGFVGLGVELLVVRPIGVVGNVDVGEKVDLGGAVDSGPPAHYFKGLYQRLGVQNVTYSQLGRLLY